MNEAKEKAIRKAVKRRLDEDMAQRLLACENRITLLHDRLQAQHEMIQRLFAIIEGQKAIRVPQLVIQ